MTSHYLGLNRGQQGFGDSDFTYGASAASPAADIEIRFTDGVGLTEKDVMLAIDAFERFLVQTNQHIAATNLIVA